MSREPQTLSAVKVEGKKGKIPSRGSRENSDFMYVNSAFVGSANSVNCERSPAAQVAPITGVYREQYWACSRWPYTQRVLAITVGVLLGALIGLCLSFFLGNDQDSGIGPIFRRHVPD